MTEPSNNQMCTLQLLYQEDLCYDNAERAAEEIWGASNASYNAQHRLFTKADYVKGNDWYESNVLSGYSNNQCIPFSVFKNWNWSQWGNNTMNFTRNLGLKTQGTINVYYYSPNFNLKIWECSWVYRGGLSVVNWNGDKDKPSGVWQCAIGSPSTNTLLYDHTYGYGSSKKVYRPLSYNYSTGWVHLFSTTWGHGGSLYPYISVCMLYDEQDYGSALRHDCSIDGVAGTGDRCLRTLTATAVSFKIDGYTHRMYSIHTPVAVSNNSTVNIYIYTDPV